MEELLVFQAVRAEAVLQEIWVQLLAELERLDKEIMVEAVALGQLKQAARTQVGLLVVLVAHQDLHHIKVPMLQDQPIKEILVVQQAMVIPVAQAAHPATGMLQQLEVVVPEQPVKTN